MPSQALYYAAQPCCAKPVTRVLNGAYADKQAMSLGVSATGFILYLTGVSNKKKIKALNRQLTFIRFINQIELTVKVVKKTAYSRAQGA